MGIGGLDGNLTFKVLFIIVCSFDTYILPPPPPQLPFCFRNHGIPTHLTVYGVNVLRHPSINHCVDDYVIVYCRSVQHYRIHRTEPSSGNIQASFITVPTCDVHCALTVFISPEYLREHEARYHLHLFKIIHVTSN